jgi:hypothetical protein
MNGCITYGILIEKNKTIKRNEVLIYDATWISYKNYAKKSDLKSQIFYDPFI